MCMIDENHTHEGLSMRTNIELDDDLIAEAMQLTGLPSKKATVDKALKDLVEHYRRKHALESLRGIGWEGDLDEMRTDWTPDKNWGFHDDDDLKHPE